MTEDEAKQKWCPFVRLDTGGNRSWQADLMNCNMRHKVCCIANGCMMWEPERKELEIVDGRNATVKYGGYCKMGKS